MSVLTVVDHYVRAAMAHAILQTSEDGVLIATVPSRGVIATGRDEGECVEDLYRRLADWVKASLARGDRLPVLDGIDLNSEAARILASYHEGVGEAEAGLAPTHKSTDEFIALLRSGMAS